MIGRFARARASGGMSSRIHVAGGLALAGAALGFAAPASAYLGSFAPADGYQILQPWVDVSYYNTGQYGANAGGGSWTHVVPDAGLWRVAPGYAGGIYSSYAARTAAMTSVVGNVYPAVPPAAGNGAIYMVGDHGPGRTDNSALAFRNDTPNNAGPARYDYTIDTYDTGGITPATVTAGVVSAQVYMLASPSAPPSPGGLVGDKFTMSLKDSSGNIGMQWGYAADNEVYWRPGSSGSWNYTGTYVNTGLWDGVKVDIDLTGQSFKMSYYVASTSTWFTMANTTALGASMTNLTNIGWQLEDGLPFGSFATKNFFDDFSFVIPAPGTGVVGLLGLGLLRRRRRTCAQ